MKMGKIDSNVRKVIRNKIAEELSGYVYEFIMNSEYPFETLPSKLTFAWDMNLQKNGVILVTMKELERSINNAQTENDQKL